MKTKMDNLRSISFILFFVFLSGVQSATIIDYLKGGNYKTLLSLLEKTGLNDTLDGAGAFTLFAPSDAAFAKIPAADLTALGSNLTALTELLKSHVTSGFLISPQIADGTSKDSLAGTKLNFRVYKNGAVIVQNAAISNADHIVRNGVVHELDKVLLPPTKNIAEYLGENDGEFKDLFAALVLTRLVHTLEGGNFTLFAPNDKAFSQILNPLSGLSATQLANVLKYHVVPSVNFAAGLENGEFLPTVFGRLLQINVSSKNVAVNNATVIKADIYLTNGVIHVIDKVLIPSGI